MTGSEPPVRSIVGAWVVPYRRLAPLTSRNISYPFGRVDVYDDRLVFRARGPFRYLARERVVAFAAVTGVQRRRGPIGKPSGVRVFHDGERTDWASRGRESEQWLAEYVENRLKEQ